MPLTAENGFLPDLDGIGRDVTDRANLLFCNYPNNPTGAVVEVDFFERLAAFGRRQGRARRPRQRLLRDHVRRLRRPELPRGARARARPAIEMFSLSKAYNMTGWRVGAAVGNADMIAALLKLKTNVDSGAVRRHPARGGARSSAREGRARRPHARRLSPAPRPRDRRARRGGPRGRRRRGARSTCGCPCRTGTRPSSFAELVLQQADVVVSPGSAYGPNGEGYVRLSLTVADDRLREAVARASSSTCASPPERADPAVRILHYVSTARSAPREPTPERGVIIASLPPGTDDGDELAEMQELLRTATVDAVATLTQHRRRPDPRTYLGPGKVDELRELVTRGRGRGGRLRRRAHAAPAARARGRAPDARRRPHRRDPRHLRPARPHRRGQAPGRARPARVLAAAHARDVAAPRAAGRRRRHPRPRRDAARVRPADRPPPRRAPAKPGSRRSPTGAA